MSTKTNSVHRRFDRIARLLGEDALLSLASRHVMIIGLGGVGSWAAESLARSGVGQISVVDFDKICITNINRQLPALSGLIGKSKAEVMAERLRAINPQATINAIAKFYNAETSDEILGAQGPDLLIDAVDNITAKCFLLHSCRSRGVPVITSGGTGSRLDPLSVAVADLSETHTDPFIQQVRKSLRVKYGFEREGAMGITCVFSTEPPSQPHALSYDQDEGFKCVCPHGQNEFQSCERRNVIHGTASFVTGTVGLTIASVAVKKLSSMANTTYPA